jgi:hypothetical protein
VGSDYHYQREALMLSVVMWLMCCGHPEGWVGPRVGSRFLQFAFAHFTTLASFESYVSKLHAWGEADQQEC